MPIAVEGAAGTNGCPGHCGVPAVDAAEWRQLMPNIRLRLALAVGWFVVPSAAVPARQTFLSLRGGG